MDNKVNIEDISSMLRKLYDFTDEGLRKNYNRSLSFQDGLFDRWERAKRLGFDEETSIYNSSLVFGDVKVGSNTWIGPFTILDGSGGSVNIGDFCSISAGVHIYTHDTVLWALSGGKAEKKTGPVTIESCVYIGSQSIITAGVKIGTKSIVSANSFVNRDVEDGSVVAGSPAKRIGSVIDEGESVKIVFDTKS